MLRLFAFSGLVNFESGLSRVASLYTRKVNCQSSGTYKGSLDQSLLTSFTSVFSALNSPSLLLLLFLLSGFGLLGLFGFTSLQHFLFPLCSGVLLLLLLLELASLALGCLEPGLLEELI